MNILSILAVGAGGFLGSIARYVTVQTLDNKLNSVFPYGTFAVNVLGSLILGIVIALMGKQTSEWKLFLATGFCGGFTTFSAFALENISIIQGKMTGTSVTYTLLSLLFGFLAVMAGMLIGRVFS